MKEEEQKEAIQLTPQQWISVEDRQPESNKNVLGKLAGGNNQHMSVVFYTKGNEIEFEDHDELFPDSYNEDHDCCYLPKGWWYLSEFEEKFWNVEVTHWMPLPSFPKF